MVATGDWAPKLQKRVSWGSQIPETKPKKTSGAKRNPCKRALKNWENGD